MTHQRDYQLEGFKALSAMFAVPTLLIAYWIQPDVATLSPTDRGIMVCTSFSAAFIFAATWEFTEGFKSYMLGVLASAIIGVGSYYYVSAGPIASYKANVRRCLAIQRDMLSAHRRLSDGPEVFQALGCRPQGDGIIRVPATDREKRVGHALPNGGYPNR